MIGQKKQQQRVEMESQTSISEVVLFETWFKNNTAILICPQCSGRHFEKHIFSRPAILPVMVQTTVSTLTEESHTMSFRAGESSSFLCSQTEGHCAVSVLFLFFIKDFIQNNLMLKQKKNKQTVVFLL